VALLEKCCKLRGTGKWSGKDNKQQRVVDREGPEVRKEGGMREGVCFV